MGQRGSPRARQMVKTICLPHEEARNPRWVSHPDLLFCFLLALAGCARVAPASAPRPITVEIPVPTPIYCQVPTLQPPILAIAALTPDSPPADTVRSYAASVDVLKSAVRERDAILQGCAAPSGTSTSPDPQPQSPQATIVPTLPKPPAASSLPSRLVNTFRKLL